MNRQEIFNKVYAYAKEMSGPSYYMAESDRCPTCAYRGTNGNKCLIGALIPDNLYCKEMEANVIENLVVEFPQLDDYFEVESEDDVNFLTTLQISHDQACEFNHRFAPDQIPLNLFKQQLMENLHGFANVYGLEIPNCV
jgi:hypothetical protein